MKHVDIDYASDAAINYVLTTIDQKVTPVLFDDFFRNNGNRLARDPERVEHLLSFQSMKGKYCLPTPDHKEAHELPEYTKNWTMAERVLGNMEIALTPIAPLSFHDKLRWKAHYTEKGSKPEWYAAESDSRISAMLRCYLKVTLGAEAKLEVPDDLDAEPVRPKFN